MVWAKIDREAWKGKPLPSDHAPLVIDVDSPRYPFDTSWLLRNRAMAGKLDVPIYLTKADEMKR